jgi:hypothetical protein
MAIAVHEEFLPLFFAGAASCDLDTLIRSLGRDMIEGASKKIPAPQCPCHFLLERYPQPGGSHAERKSPVHNHDIAMQSMMDARPLKIIFAPKKVLRGAMCSRQVNSAILQTY